MYADARNNECCANLLSIRGRTISRYRCNFACAKAGTIHRLSITLIVFRLPISVDWELDMWYTLFC